MGNDSLVVEYKLIIPTDTPLGTTITFNGNVASNEGDTTVGIAGDTQLEIITNVTPDTVIVCGEKVPTEFTTETDSGERTVIADNAVEAINTSIFGRISSDVAVDAINAFINS